MLTRTLACVALVTVITPAAPAQSRLGGAVRIDASSTVYPITEAVAEEFFDVSPNVKVTVGISGTFTE